MKENDDAMERREAEEVGDEGRGQQYVDFNHKSEEIWGKKVLKC